MVGHYRVVSLGQPLSDVDAVDDPFRFHDVNFVS